MSDHVHGIGEAISRGRRRLTRLVRNAFLFLVAILLFSLAAYRMARTPEPEPHALRITAGSPSGIRHELAHALAREVGSNGVELGVEGTAGSEAALDAVDSGELDFALIQGGLSLTGRDHVRQVATLVVEPLHLLVRGGDVHERVSRDLAALLESTRGADGDLRPISISLSSRGSGTYTLSRAVLHFSGLDVERLEAEGHLTSEWTYARLMAETDPSRLPDAVFTVSSLPSPVARDLVREHGYRLVPLRFSQAFSLDGLGESAAAAELDLAGENRVVKAHIQETTIPAFAYSVTPPVPESPVPTLGTRLLLVAHADVPPAAVAEVVATVYRSSFAGLSRPALTEDLLDEPPDVPWHAGTIRFRDSKKPLIAADLFQTLEGVVAIGAPRAGGIVFFTGFVLQRARNRNARSFRRFLQRVSDVERLASEVEEDQGRAGLERLLDLRRELGAIKGEALDRFGDGRLVGEDLMGSFLIHVNDVRGAIVHQIFQERQKRLQSSLIDQRRRTESLLRHVTQAPADVVT